MREVRFIVTAYCNENCVFCHREGYWKLTKSLLSPNDYRFLFSVVRDCYNFSSCTLTGGEPFLRSDIDEIVKELYNEGASITIVSNGTYVKEKQNILNSIDELHLSLHTLNQEKWIKVTRGTKAQYDALMDAISIVKKYSIRVKINTCVMKGINDDIESLSALYNFCKENQLHLRFIELLKPYGESFFENIARIENWLQSLGVVSVRRDKLRYRETIYRMRDGMVVSIIKYLCNYRKSMDRETGVKMCKDFLDIFITHDGKIKYCFLTEDGLSILDEVKKRDRQRLVFKLKQGVEQMGTKCPIP